MVVCLLMCLYHGGFRLSITLSGITRLGRSSAQALNFRSMITRHPNKTGRHRLTLRSSTYVPAPFLSLPFLFLYPLPRHETATVTGEDALQNSVAELLSMPHIRANDACKDRALARIGTSPFSLFSYSRQFSGLQTRIERGHTRSEMTTHANLIISPHCATTTAGLQNGHANAGRRGCLRRLRECGVRTPFAILFFPIFLIFIPSPVLLA